METFSALLVLSAGNSLVTGAFPSQRPVTRSFDVFFDLRQKKRLSKQWRRWWFETPSRPLCRHCNDYGWDKLAAILQPFFSNVFYSMKANFCQFGTGDDLAPNRWHAIIWNKIGEVDWCIYTSFGRNNLLCGGISPSNIHDIFITNVIYQRLKKNPEKQFCHRFTPMCV